MNRNKIVITEISQHLAIYRPYSDITTSKTPHGRALFLNSLSEYLRDLFYKPGPASREESCT